MLKSALSPVPIKFVEGEVPVLPPVAQLLLPPPISPQLGLLGVPELNWKVFVVVLKIIKPFAGSAIAVSTAPCSNLGIKSPFREATISSAADVSGSKVFIPTPPSCE